MTVIISMVTVWHIDHRPEYENKEETILESGGT